MAEVEKKDLVQGGIDKLISHWKDKPKAVGLLTSYLKEIQKVEDILHQINNETGLESAAGVQLDTIGLLIGVARDGSQDASYRDAIKARIGLNDASGSINDVKSVAKLVANSSSAKIYEHYPACTYLYTNNLVTKEADSAIQDAHVAGTRSRVLWFGGDNHFQPSGLLIDNAQVLGGGGDFGDGEIALVGDNSDGSSYLVTTSNNEVIVVDSDFASLNTGFDVLTDSSPISRSSFTSLVPGATGYEVIDDNGKFCSLVPFDRAAVSTGYIIDHLGRYIVTDKSEYIRYVKFEKI